jgi:hypothetical protein
LGWVGAESGGVTRCWALSSFNFWFKASRALICASVSLAKESGAEVIAAAIKAATSNFDVFMTAR